MRPQEFTATSPAGELTIHRARPEDAEAVTSVLDDAMRWGFARGFRKSGPPETLLADTRRRIGEHEVYLARHGELPAATLTLAWDHPELWGDLPAAAGYIYAYASARAFAGQQVGLALLRWTERYIAASGKTRARLECRANSPGLRAYYEGAGYLWRGDVRVGTGELARYEKILRAGEADEREHAQ